MDIHEDISYRIHCYFWLPIIDFYIFPDIVIVTIIEGEFPEAMVFFTANLNLCHHEDDVIVSETIIFQVMVHFHYVADLTDVVIADRTWKQQSLLAIQYWDQWCEDQYA